MKNGVVQRINGRFRAAVLSALTQHLPGWSVADINILGDGCRFPIGDPRDRDFKFCGNPRDGDRPYCSAHCAVCYRTADQPFDKTAIAA